MQRELDEVGYRLLGVMHDVLAFGYLQKQSIAL